MKQLLFRLDESAPWINISEQEVSSEVLRFPAIKTVRIESSRWDASGAISPEGDNILLTASAFNNYELVRLTAAWFP
jgi:hypothetical protein